MFSIYDKPKHITLLNIILFTLLFAIFKFIKIKFSYFGRARSNSFGNFPLLITKELYLSANQDQEQPVRKQRAKSQALSSKNTTVHVKKEHNPCPGNNTVIVNHKCRCKAGYKGFPLDERGCFKCDSCYSDEICAYPGRCTCNFGMMRAENQECIGSSLQMLSAYPTTIDKEYGGTVTVEVYPKDVTIRTLYCFFAHQITIAQKGDNQGEVKCHIKAFKKSDSFLFVSDSKTQWPAHGLLIRVIKHPKSDFTQEAQIATGLSLFVCLGFTFISFKFFRAQAAKAARYKRELNYAPN